jgi:hypothetical protein
MMNEVQVALEYKPTPAAVLQAQISAGIIAGAPAESIVEEPPSPEYGEAEACGVIDRCASEKGGDICLLCRETFKHLSKACGGATIRIRTGGRVHVLRLRPSNGSNDRGPSTRLHHSRTVKNNQTNGADAPVV